MEKIDKKRFSDKALKDFELIDQAVEGDERAYAQLMERYRKSVYHTMLKMIRNVDDAEDLAIEAFAKAFKNLHKFKKDYTFSTWLFRIATNNCIDFIRKKKLNTFSIHTAVTTDDSGTMQLDIMDSNRNPQEEAIRTQKLEIVRAFVTLLPPKYQRLVKLRYFEEYS
ncbi:MAG: RNA polymerase sigma factor (sigma-70 family), partial [Bacteroidia bacterium]